MEFKNTFDQNYFESNVNTNYRVFEYLTKTDSNSYYGHIYTLINVSKYTYSIDWKLHTNISISSKNCLRMYPEVFEEYKRTIKLVCLFCNHSILKL